jgi:hypothetical protein
VLVVVLEESRLQVTFLALLRSLLDVVSSVESPPAPCEQSAGREGLREEHDVRVVSGTMNEGVAGVTGHVEDSETDP